MKKWCVPVKERHNSILQSEIFPAVRKYWEKSRIKGLAGILLKVAYIQFFEHPEDWWWLLGGFLLSTARYFSGQHCHKRKSAENWQESSESLMEHDTVSESFPRLRIQTSISLR